MTTRLRANVVGLRSLSYGLQVLLWFLTGTALVGWGAAFVAVLS